MSIFKHKIYCTFDFLFTLYTLSNPKGMIGFEDKIKRMKKKSRFEIKKIKEKYLCLNWDKDGKK